MTLSTSDNTVRYAVTALGVPFPFPPKFFKDEQLVVSSLRDGVVTKLTLGSDYTVSGAKSDAGGTVTVTSGIMIGDTLIIQRVVPVKQETDLRNQGEYLAETVEDAFDYLTMITQQLVGSIGRLLQFPDSDPDTISTVIPPFAARATKLLAFDASGDPIVSSLTLSQIEQQPALALASAEAAQTSAAASEASAMDAAIDAAAAAASAIEAAKAAASVDGRAGRFFGEVVMLPNRTSSPNGVVKADGQLISNALALYPEVVANLQSGSPSVPVTTPAIWLSDPTKRLCWAYDSVNDQIRVPDWNGKSAGSLGPAFFRGDGSLGFETGTLRRDQVQPFAYGSGTFPALVNPVSINNAKPSAFVADSAWNVTGVSDGSIDSTATNSLKKMVPVPFGGNGTPRLGTETFPTHGVGVWGVVLFGTISNAGAADAAALATSYANQQTQLQTLDDSLGFAIIYPNGGTASAPANAAINSRYVSANPFPGFNIICIAEIQLAGKWGETSFIFGSNGAGVKSSQYDDTVVTQTGGSYLKSFSSAQSGDPHNTTSGTVTSAPVRVKVWKCKGKV